MSEEDVRRYLESAPPAEPPPDHRARSKPNGHDGPPIVLPVAFASQWDGLEVPEREWIVPGMIPTRSVTLFTGHGGAGKSTLLVQLQACLGSYGAEWLGRECMQVASLGVYAEDEESELQRRMQAICGKLGLDMAELQDTALVSTAGMENQLLCTVDHETGLVVPTPLFEAIRIHARDIGARLIILDGAADVFGGNENDRGQVRSFLGMLRRLAIEIDGGVVLIAHPSRAGMRDDSGTSGSTHWHNGARSLWYFTRPEYEEGEAYDPDLRELRQLKSQFGPLCDPIQMKWQDGALIVDQKAAGVVGKIEDSLAERKFLEALDKIMAQGRYVSEKKNATNYAPKMLREAMEPPLSLRAMERAMRNLFQKGAIMVGEVKDASRHAKSGIVRTGSGMPAAPPGPLFDGD